MDCPMKKLSVIVLILLLLFSTGCAYDAQSYDIIATTLPVFDFTSILCEGTPLHVGRLVTENVSCLHDYTLQVGQMRMIESADTIVISGCGLEDFLKDALHSVELTIDASVGVHVHSNDHSHDEADPDDHGHQHDQDPHFWLSPENAGIMVSNICEGLSDAYPEYTDTFRANLLNVNTMLSDLEAYGDSQLSDLSCRELITFHDGFSYFAESFDLTILEAIEEESGSEASAAEIIHLIELVDCYDLPAVFTERSGSDACAGIISAETGVKIYSLDMAMAGNSYFEAMYHNIDIVKEALG